MNNILKFISSIILLAINALIVINIFSDHVGYSSIISSIILTMNALILNKAYTVTVCSSMQGGICRSTYSTLNIDAYSVGLMAVLYCFHSSSSRNYTMHAHQIYKSLIRHEDSKQK